MSENATELEDENETEPASANASDSGGGEGGEAGGGGAGGGGGGGGAGGGDAPPIGDIENIKSGIDEYITHINNRFRDICGIIRDLNEARDSMEEKQSAALTIQKKFRRDKVMKDNKALLQAGTEQMQQAQEMQLEVVKHESALAAATDEHKRALATQTAAHEERLRASASEMEQAKKKERLASEQQELFSKRVVTSKEKLRLKMNDMVALKQDHKKAMDELVQKHDADVVSLREEGDSELNRLKAEVVDKDRRIRELNDFIKKIFTKLDDIKACTDTGEEKLLKETIEEKMDSEQIDNIQKAQDAAGVKGGSSKRKSKNRKNKNTRSKKRKNTRHIRKKKNKKVKTNKK